LNRVGIVAALATEARALSSSIGDRGVPLALEDGTLLAVSGLGCVAAANSALALIKAGACALASFGLAGGLDPALVAGTIFLPAEVALVNGAPLPSARAWRERLALALSERRPVTHGKLLTSEEAIADVAAKAATFRTTGAAAVDMESVAVAQMAATHGLPFLAVKVIVDTAQDALPKSVMAASDSGQLQLWRLIGALALAPRDVVGVIRLARQFRIAHRSLRAVAQSHSLREPSIG
jgi:adenosylhomocysteine nucleosidase